MDGFCNEPKYGPRECRNLAVWYVLVQSNIQWHYELFLRHSSFTANSDQQFTSRLVPLFDSSNVRCEYEFKLLFKRGPHGGSSKLIKKQ